MRTASCRIAQLLTRDKCPLGNANVPSFSLLSSDVLLFESGRGMQLEILYILILSVTVKTRDNVVEVSYPSIS